MHETRSAAGEHYLHVIRDEKFIDGARALFESTAPGSHSFVIVGNPAPLVHISTFEPEAISLDYATSEAFLGRMARCRAVFLHGLSPPARSLVWRASPSTRFVWLGWGGDYYHLIRAGDDLLLPETRLLTTGLRQARHHVRWFRRLRTAFGVLRRPRIWRTFRAQLRLDRDLRRIGPGMQDEDALLAKIRLFAPVLLEEFPLIRNKHPAFEPCLVAWNYDINESLAHARRKSAPALGGNVLLGNSATPENNHPDAFALLGDVGGRTVVCPLSYGDASYAALISRLGRGALGEAFHPLDRFVPPLEYADLMRSCGIVVMNHLRQQALGTIIAALCNGAKVFLRPENPLYAFFRNSGVRVFTIDELPTHLATGAKPLGDAEVAHARAVIDGQFGTAALLHKTRNLLQACDALRARAA